MELYRNEYNTSAYAYARPYSTSLETGEYRQVTGGNGSPKRRLIDIYIVGVADGVSPKVRETLVPVGTPRRLYVFSDTPLGEETLNTVDSHYGRCAYPLLTLDTPCARLDSDRVPTQNFYTAVRREGVAEAAASRRQDASFVEYRYAQQRHTAANIFYDETTQSVYRLALPADSAMLVLVMPRNFVRTGLKRGYFLFDNIDLIVRVFSKHLLSAARTDDTETMTVNDICTGNRRVMDIVRTFYSRMGVHNVYSPSDNQIVGYDQFLTLVVGDVSNTNM